MLISPRNLRACTFNRNVWFMALPIRTAYPTCTPRLMTPA
jgi:hypothetical protein